MHKSSAFDLVTGKYLIKYSASKELEQLQWQRAEKNHSIPPNILFLIFFSYLTNRSKSHRCQNIKSKQQNMFWIQILSSNQLSQWNSNQKDTVTKNPVVPINLHHITHKITMKILIKLLLTTGPLRQNALFQGCNTCGRRKAFWTDIWTISQPEPDLKLISRTSHLQQQTLRSPRSALPTTQLGLLVEWISHAWIENLTEIRLHLWFTTKKAINI